MLPRFLLVFGVLAGLFGLTLLGINAYLSRASLWAPLTVSVPTEAGSTLSGGFVSQIDGVLELEIELPLEAPLGTSADSAEVFSGAGAIALEWRVHADGQPLARGDSASPLYLGRRHSSFRSVLKSVVYGSPLIADRSVSNLFGLLTKPAAVSGIGRFRAEAGIDYLIEARINESGPLAIRAKPVLRVRARRKTWKVAEAQVMAFGFAGKYVLGLTALALCGAFALNLAHGRRRP